MTVLFIKAKVECDACGKHFDVSVDGAMRCNDAHEAVLEAMTGGDGSVYDGVMRCDDCSSAYVSQWIAENPNKVSGIEETPDGWRITTYAEAKHFIPKAGAPRAPQFEEEVGPLLMWSAAAETLDALRKAAAIIDAAYQDLHSSRVADWYPEGANNAAVHMSEEMRRLGNWLADVDFDGVIAKAEGRA